MHPLFRLRLLTGQEVRNELIDRHGRRIPLTVSAGSGRSPETTWTARETPTDAVPEARISQPGAKVTHGAAIGGVDRCQLETITARSLASDQVVKVFLQGMLD